MRDVPKVSIVVPNYNGEAWLRETIESVRAQTFPDWEMIVVDDGSTDASAAVVCEHGARDPRVRLLALDRNYGRPSIPRNFGVEAARGDYIAFLDADDLWHPQKLEIQLGTLARTGTRFISSRLRDFQNRRDIEPMLSQPLAPPARLQRIDHASLLRKNVIPTSSVLAESGFFRRHRFLEDPRYKAIEDYHCWLCIHQHEITHSYKLPMDLVYYRRTQSSISRSKLAMFHKNRLLFSEYRVGGESLGWRKYLYLSTYVGLSLFDTARRTLTMRFG